MTNHSQELCIILDGPFLRTSYPVQIGGSVSNLLVYSAEINMFSPYGVWRIERSTPATPQPHRGLPHLLRQNERVQLNITFGCCGHASAFTVSPPNACASGPGDIPSIVRDVCGGGHLGHEPAPSVPAAAATAAGRGAGGLGSDHFRFEGEAGDTIELTLERDGARGSAGELARLSLREENGGSLEQLEDALPLELEATLPASGHYVVEVAEVAPGPDGEAFRGHYRLRATTSADGVVLLEPLDSVEP